MKTQKGEIVYCNLTLFDGKKKVKAEKVVYKDYGDGLFHNNRILRFLGFNEPLKILSVKVISRLGFENKPSGYTEVKGSDEKRNKITGAYE